MYERIEGRYLISFKNLEKMLDASNSLIYKEIEKNKIEVFKYKGSNFITKKDSKIVKKNLSKDRICKMCGKDFIAKFRYVKYCSKHCRDKNNQLNFIKGTTNKSIGSKLIEGKIRNTKLMNCSVECLLEEFGNIE